MTEALALYIHWPFCAAKCPYCDFNSHVRTRIEEGRYRAALQAELAYEAARFGRRRLHSIFFGGGTPSLMQPETVAALIAQACQLFAAEAALEITLEANPTRLEAGRLAAFRAAGVNRLSLGVQALDEAALRFLGRGHSVAEALAAFAAARAIFPQISIDLIYARPGQSETAWRAELREALALGPNHLSAYQLTIEAHTPFAARYARGDFALPEAETAARLYCATHEEAARAGLHAYEVSNYAQPGAECRHNLTYWRYGDYLGIGPGAHQRMQSESGVVALRRRRAPEAWLARVEAEGHGAEEEERLTPHEAAREALLMGLRLREGIDPARLEARTGLTLAAAVEETQLARLLEEGYLVWQAGQLVATSEGLLRLDSVVMALLR